MPRTPERSYLNDAIHLFDGTNRIKAEIADAQKTLDHSIETVIAANRDLERHQQWLERHRELYAEDMKRAQRHLRRHALVKVCKQAAMLPLHLISSRCAALLRGTRTALTNPAERDRLQSRINAVEWTTQADDAA
jgi:hypothetical protein